MKLLSLRKKDRNEKGVCKMSEYIPDRWVVLKIKESKGSFPFYKVLGGWSGGYLDGDYWRLNSGITLVFEREDTIDFYGQSGSLYHCHKDRYGLSMANAGIYNRLKDNETFGGQIQLIPEDTDWSKIIGDNNDFTL